MEKSHLVGVSGRATGKKHIILSGTGINEVKRDLYCSNGHKSNRGSTVLVFKGKPHCPICGERLTI